MTNYPTAWSYSRLICYELCPFQYKCRHIDKLPEETPAAFVRGRDVHQKAADYLTGKLDTPTPEIQNFGVGLFQELRALNPIVEQQWAFDAAWKTTGYFSKTVWLRAILDAAVVYPDGTADVVDHKTGKKYGTNDDQMNLFAVVTFAQMPSVNKVVTRLWYLDSGDEDIAEFQRNEYAAMKKDWEKRAAHVLNDRTFPARPNEKCRFCSFSRSNNGPCRFG